MRFRSISKLLSAQEVVNAKDRDVVVLKSEVKALNESKAELRLLSVIAYYPPLILFLMLS